MTEVILKHLRTPEKCTRFKFRQHSVKPRHPTHHCDFFWPSTGNITNLPAENLCRHPCVALCQKVCAFYSHATLQAECRKYAVRRSKEGECLELAALVTHPHSSIHLSGLRVNVNGAQREPTIQWLISAWKSWRLNSVFIQKVFTSLWGEYLPLRWGSSKGLQPQSPEQKRKVQIRKQ